MLAVTRTVTTTTRLLDVLDLVREDARIQVVFTVEPGSAFTDGVVDFVRSFGGRLVPWDQVLGMSFDLVIAASEAGDLHLLDAPVVVLPHGAGHNKYIKTEPGAPRSVSGFRADQLVRDGRVVPIAIVLSHEEQLNQLALSCPPALPRAVVAGDVCLDRLSASRSHRSRYRRALGLHDRQRLVVVNSTWGARSVFAQHLRLPARMLAELPADEYRVALVLHPSVWFGHSPYQVRGWLASAIGAGLLLVPPHEGWRATLVAADVLVSDHGSLSLYGAALGVPLMLGAFDDEEVVPTSPMAELADHAPRLRPDADLRTQIETAIADHDPTIHDPITRRAFALRDQATRVLRTLLYDTMSLAQDDAEFDARPVGDPEPEVRPVTAHRVVTTVSHDSTVAVERFPATLPEPSWPSHNAEHDQHLAVEHDSFDTALLDSAAVLLASVRPHDAVGWGRSALAAHPGARVAATADSLVVRGNGGRLHLFDLDRTAVEPSIAASAVYALSAADRLTPAQDRLTVRLGSRTHEVRFRFRDSYPG
ncbi:MULTISPECIES: hypothetical protein [Saccharothrix]|uniref:hypothetical protein n=1 Tax=Saccharothrix TaxID=2071 RepID=UPI001300DC2A|nr:hypothetical protein [Saccharothrix sp. CB00851]